MKVSSSVPALLDIALLDLTHAATGLEQIRQSFQNSGGPHAVLVNKPVGRRDLLRALVQAIATPADGP